MVEWTATPATRSTYEDFPPAEPLAPILNDAVSDVLLSYKALAFILVLGLPRTATKATLQFFHKNYADRAKVAHAHGISPRFQKTLFDLVDQEKINAFERVRKLLNIAKRTLIVITLREPVSRIYSYYLYFNRNRIGSFFDPQNQTFSDRGGIQTDFDRFALEEATRECLWYSEELQDAFGLDLGALPVATLVAPAVLAQGGRDFLFVRSETLSETMNGAANKAPGWSGTRLKRRNSASEHGLAGLDQAFRETFQFPLSATSHLEDSTIVRRLFSSPEPL